MFHELEGNGCKTPFQWTNRKIDAQFSARLTPWNCISLPKTYCTKIYLRQQCKLFMGHPILFRIYRDRAGDYLTRFFPHKSVSSGTLILSQRWFFCIRGDIRKRIWINGCQIHRDMAYNAVTKISWKISSVSATADTNKTAPFYKDLKSWLSLLTGHYFQKIYIVTI